MRIDAVEIQLQGSVSNIFDEDPPIARLELGYNPLLGKAGYDPREKRLQGFVETSQDG